MCDILLRLGRYRESLSAIRQAITLKPQDEYYHALLGLCLVSSGKHDEALEKAQKLSETTLSSAYAYDVLNRLFTMLGELVSAAEMAEAAARIQPGNLNFQFNLATALRAIGDLKRAEKVYDHIIEHNPKDWEAYKNRSDLKAQCRQENHISELRSVLEQTSDWQARMQVLSALAKELEDIGECQDAFSTLKQCNDLRHAHMRYDVALDVQALEAIQVTFAGEKHPENGFKTNEPIFILGLPRTGSTLLERMLSMHSDVDSAGELQNFAVEMIKAIRGNNNSNNNPDRMEMIANSALLNAHRLGQNYVKSTRPRTGHTRHFIDKMPTNFLYLGLIRRALPNAKVIYMNRHPMDTCYAIYKTLFKHAYPFSYNLNDLAQYYVAHRKLREHWTDIMPGFILNVSYENLVTDTETELRRVLTFCELGWQDNMLNYTESKMPTNTASAAQVRQPIYHSSIGKWRNYSQELVTLSGYLQEHGINID